MGVGRVTMVAEAEAVPGVEPGKARVEAGARPADVDGGGRSGHLVAHNAPDRPAFP